MTPLLPLRPRAFLVLMAACLLCTAPAAGPLPVSAEGSPTLRKIRDTGIITLGHRVASLPFSYLDSKLRPVGYSMDLCMKVVEHLRSRPDMRELEVKHVAVTSATRMPLVANGSVDLECGITTNTAERQKTPKADC
jgi:glutamate/aspartate transport system substrate-binding protein